MSGETIVTIVGNLVAPAELRFVPAGDAVANFTIASTPRVFKNEAWSDGPTLFMRCSAWRELAENIAESLTDKGMGVIAQGNLTQRSFETREGEKRTVVELQVTDIGPALKYATAKVTRKQGGTKHVGGSSFAKSRGGAPDDPWVTDSRPMTGGASFPNDEPPF